MPPPAGDNALFYAERLSVPWHWWLIAAAVVGFGGAEVWAGFSWQVAVVVYTVLGAPTVALLLGMGRERVSVDGLGLHARGRTIALGEIASLSVLDAREARLRLGPRADPRAHLATRGYVRQAVEVTPIDDRDVPYWLLSTRHPAELVNALREAVLQHRG